MDLFRSRFAKLQAYAAAKPEDRTPEMLASAQEDMNAAGLILVPMSDTVKSGADLQKHVDGLEAKATEATAAATDAQNALKALKGERVLPTQKVGGDKGDGGDKGPQTEEEKRAQAIVTAAKQKDYTQRVERMLNAED